MSIISPSQAIRKMSEFAINVGVLTIIASGTAFPQDEGPVEKINAEAAHATITATPIRGDLTVLSGSGGTITVLKTGRDWL